MKINNRKGFTLIELIIVIVLLGLLAAAALPKFSDLESEARNASEQGVIGGFRAAIGISHADWLAKGKKTTIELEGTTIQMSTEDDNDPGGYPESTSTANGTMTPAKCLEVYKAILTGPPEAGVAADCTAESTCQVLVTGTGKNCTYTFEKGDGTAFVYNIETGAVTTP